MSEKIDQQLKDTKDAISIITKRRKNSESDLSLFYQNAQESFEFYKSKQYDPKVVAALKAKGLPYHVINICKDTVNTMSGFQRQNPTEPTVLPIEGTDERISEVMGRIIKWSMEQDLNKANLAIAFKDKVICGLGVNFVYPDFSDDPVNGELKIKNVSPFDVKFDPLMKSPDLSDCRYIIHEGRLEKEEIIHRFKAYREEIDGLEPGEQKGNFTGETRTTDKRDRGLVVTEHWFREQYDQECYFDEETENIVVFEGDEDEKAVLEEVKKVKIFTRRRSRIQLQILVEDKVLVYNGPNPYGIDYYPFVFDLGYFEPGIDDWEIKLCGDVDRSLKDINKEKNKRRSQMSAIVAKSPHTGFFVEEGGVSDENKLEKTGGAAKIIHYRRGGQPPTPIIPVQIPPALIQLEQMTSEDQYKSGLKAEMLGQTGERGAPLGLHRMRQQQSLLSVQEEFDNHAICVKQIGKIMIALILKHFSNKKVKRIVGTDLVFVEQKAEFKKRIKELERFVPRSPEETEKFNAEVQALKIEMTQAQEEEETFWETWEDLSQNSRFDIQIDEGTNSTTYKMETEQMLLAFQQNSGAVPFDVIVEMSSLPKSIKEKLLNNYYQQQQQQQQMLQEERQMKMAIETQRMETERLKAMAGMSGKPEVAKQLQQ